MIPVKGNEVKVAYCVHTWSTLSEEQLNAPLKDYKNCDILTSDTMKGLLRNNEKIN